MDKPSKISKNFGEVVSYTPERIAELVKLGAESDLPDDFLPVINAAIEQAGNVDPQAAQSLRNIYKGLIVDTAQSEGVSPQIVLQELQQSIAPPKRQMN